MTVVLYVSDHRNGFLNSSSSYVTARLQLITACELEFYVLYVLAESFVFVCVVPTRPMQQFCGRLLEIYLKDIRSELVSVHTIHEI